MEASDNVFSRSKDISLERLHYHVSTNLALLQANLTYMHANSYHWIPDLYRRMKLPVFDGVQEALEKHNMRKRKLERENNTSLKNEDRAQKVVERSEWSKTHGCDAHGGNDEHESDNDKVLKRKRGLQHVNYAGIILFFSKIKGM